jgi:hypothetical protein
MNKIIEATKRELTRIVLLKTWPEALPLTLEGEVAVAHEL